MVERTLIYPDFTLAGYRDLLMHMATLWDVKRLADAVHGRAGLGSLILRHDVDFSPALALPMAEIEGDLGVRATYFIALHLHYNPHTPLHASALRRMVTLGHEIGLHYDGAVYDLAGSPEAQRALLQQHVEVLQDICQAPITSIARHNPSVATGRDPFAVGTPFFNAYDPSLFQNTVYLSDSCRAWRNGGLMPCWDEVVAAHLLTHPPGSLGRPGGHRAAGFLRLLCRPGLQEQDDFFAEVLTIWEAPRRRPGTRSTDAEQRYRQEGARVSKLRCALCYLEEQRGLRNTLAILLSYVADYSFDMRYGTDTTVMGQPGRVSASTAKTYSTEKCISRHSRCPWKDCLKNSICQKTAFLSTWAVAKEGFCWWPPMQA